MYYLLSYYTVSTYLEERKVYRNDHLELAKKAYKKGELVMAGALDDPADQALLVFRTSESAMNFAEKDPYVKNGLIKKWEVRPWNVVIGKE